MPATTLVLEVATIPPRKAKKQEGPPIGDGVRNATPLITQRMSSTILAITYSENVYVLPRIDSHGRVDGDNNSTPAIYAMHTNRNQPCT